MAGIFLAAAAARAATVQVIEYYNASQDHYFMSSLAADIQALDSGQFQGWARTGRTFEAYPTATGNASPVCRFYIPPAQGDSHFYSASPAECQQTAAKFPTFIEESSAVMYVDLPDQATGACPAGDVPVYRVWDNRADSNHRYMIDRNLRAQMIAQGWIAEGYGPDQVIMCAPSTVAAASIPPSCVGTDPNVGVSNAPHGMYVWNPTSFPAYQSALASNVIGRDPSLCGASLVISWASVAPSNGLYDWSAVYAAAKPYTDAALMVNLLFSEATEGAVNNVTPAWVTQPVASGGAGAPTVACADQPVMPVYFNATYEAAWTAFIAAAIHEFSYTNSPLARSVGYMRFATAGGAEALPPPGYNDGGPCQALWTAAGYSYANWNAHEARIITAMGSQPTDKQIMASLPNVSGGPNVYDASNMAAAVAAAKHVGFSFENLGVSDVATAASMPAACNPQVTLVNLHWCQAYTNYAGQVPLAAQPITATYSTSQATMDIAKLLQYAVANHIQILELYPYEWTQANSPGSPNFVAAKQAEYQQALGAAAQVLGATNGR
ncbi:MAG TPA: hypothetical protein VMN56_13115 [Casimicrobiaceae bacterium]|nr:hypothetical protein [Casimicrobiaceae bacterium]